MKRFYVITNLPKDPAMMVASRIRNYLQTHGRECILQTGSTTGEHSRYKYTDPATLPEGVDCVLVLGGDGTVLRASRDLAECRIPIFGVNLGTLGYLAQTDEEHLEQALDHLMLDEYELEERMMLQGTVYHNGEVVLSDTVLNDIVIARSAVVQMRRFHIFVNDRLLNSYNADGIIVSTPTGSTGYSLSVGGPIVSPAASLILISPISPHTLTSRSVVLPDDAKIRVELGVRSNEFAEAEASFDGDSSARMVCGDYITIEKAPGRIPFAKVDQVSFLEILRRKMSGT
ncbi:MAG: NAD(+)/NADH kinase [Eubacteriales bacterium]|nr:NAD(+)/NADH kinase [Eubacteriales bacterium]